MCIRDSTSVSLERASRSTKGGEIKQLAVVRMVCSHVPDMTEGIPLGFRSKMKSVYAHFPSNIVIQKNNSLVEIQNFLGDEGGGRNIHRVSQTQKDELILEGSNVELVSNSAALIQQATTLKTKSIEGFGW